MKAKDMMTRDVVLIQEHMTLEEAAQLLIDHDVSGAPVVDVHGKLVGMLSEGDLIRTQKPISRPLMLMFLDGAFPLNYREINAELHALTSTQVSDLMTRDVKSLGPEASEEDLARLMIDQSINRIPILQEGQVVGIVSRQDMIRARFSAFQKEDNAAL